MELRQLEYFVGVFDAGSLSGAAKTLTMSQPALTRQIQKLERECGVSLYERVPAGVVPTSAGAALYQHAIALLRGVDAAKDAIRSAGPVHEIVEVGLAPGLPPDWLDSVIDTIHTRVPRAHAMLTDATSTIQLNLVRSGRLDIGFVHEPPPSELLGIRVLREPFGIAAAPSAEIPPDTGGCSLALVDGLAVLAHSRDQVPIGHDQLVAAAHSAGVRPHWQFANYTENARACVRATGSVAAILTRTTSRRLLPDWRWRELVDPPIRMQTWIVRQPSARRTVSEVFDAIQSAHRLPD